MSSNRQRKKGYPLPENEFEEETTSYCITIPTGYEYFKAMESQLQALGLWWMWKRDNDRMTAASDTATTWRQLLTIEENCGDGDMATQEDIAKGMYQAMNWLALQIASGSYQNLNISTDADGVVTLPSGDPDEELPEDDESTPIDESLTAKAGGAIAVRLGFNDIWTIVATSWAASPTSQAACTARLFAIYKWVSEPECAAFVNDYYAARSGAASYIAAFTTVLDGRMYCKGVTKLALNDWIYETFTGSQLSMALDLSVAIAEEQMTDWFTYGTQAPSSAYLEYSCTKIATESFSLDMATGNIVQYTTNGIWKAGHRYRIDVTGSYSDSDVPDLVGDGMYFYTPSTGAKVFSSLNFNFGGAVSAPPQAQVPYSASHVYSFTVEKNAGSGNAAGIISRDNGAMTTPNVTGIINVTVTDLGEFAI